MIGTMCRELAQLTRGVAKVNVEEWQAHTTYENGYTMDSQPVLWFWRAVRAFSSAQQVYKMAMNDGEKSGNGCLRLYALSYM